MKITSKLLLFMIILSFGFLTAKSVINADWWDRGERPVLPRQEITLPTQPDSQPTSPPDSHQQPSVTPPKQGGTEATQTTDPGESTDDDPCAEGESYTGDYCGWSPAIGGGEGGADSYYDPGTPEVMGLSYTDGEEIRLSDIMLLSGILCLALYAKSKFAPVLNVKLQGKRRSR